MTLVDRFLKYVSFDTQSDESTGLTPSTPKQMIFAEYLKKELESLGLEDITLDEHGYLFATLPANIDKEVPTIGFIAHMDTSPDMTGKDVTPRIVEKYDGSDIVLCAEENVILSPSQFPELLDHKLADQRVQQIKNKPLTVSLLHFQSRPRGSKLHYILGRIYARIYPLDIGCLSCYNMCSGYIASSLKCYHFRTCEGGKPPFNPPFKRAGRLII